jgi:hypothetical protein
MPMKPQSREMEGRPKSPRAGNPAHRALCLRSPAVERRCSAKFSIRYEDIHCPAGYLLFLLGGVLHGAYGRRMPEYLRMHIDALLRLSHAARDRAVAIELREMADECRIMLSVANINELAADIKQQTSDRRRLNARQIV